MTLEPGHQLLHYRLLSKAGEGGMGVVWKAVDTTLDREVAIKILPAGFVGDADRAARFEREAKLLASLSHPNIAAIHSVHRAPAQDAGPFLAMEWVEGEDLAQRIARAGALPLDDALEIARQVAEALAAAHASGVIHRDLKTANVKLTPDGLRLGRGGPLRSLRATLPRARRQVAGLDLRGQGPDLVARRQGDLLHARQPYDGRSRAHRSDVLIGQPARAVPDRLPARRRALAGLRRHARRTALPHDPAPARGSPAAASQRSRAS